MEKKIRNRYRDVEAYITRDGSEIRELMHPAQHAVSNQSLAEAIIPVGEETLLHRHERSEEIYYILEGDGIMRLGDDEFAVAAGDAVCIPPSSPHNIRNSGAQPLKLLCCCTPAYAHADTYVYQTDDNPAGKDTHVTCKGDRT